MRKLPASSDFKGNELKPGRWLIIFFAIAALTHLVFFIYAVRNESYLIKDSTEYLRAAENLFSGHGWYAGDLNKTYQPNLESRRPPLYPFFIGLIKTILKSDFFLLLFQNLLSLINLAGIIILLSKFKTNNRYNLFILLLILFFPSQFIFSNMIMAEVLFQTCIFWSFFFLVFFFQEKKIFQLILHSIFITLAVLTKPVLYLFWIPELIFFIILFLKKRISFPVIFLSIIPLLAVITISFYNKKTTGYFHYSSMKTTNLMAYNVYQTLRLNHSEIQATEIIDKIYAKAERSANFQEFSQTVENSGLKLIKENLPGYFYLTFKGIISFFLDVGRHDMYLFFATDFKESEQGISYYYKQDGIKGIINYMKQFSPLLITYSFLILLVNLFIFIAIILFIFNKNIQPEIRIYTLIIIIYLAGITGPIGSARFRVPVYPIILFTVPFFIEYLKNSHLYKKLKWL